MTAPIPNVIEFQDVALAYAGRPVLSGASFAIADGEFVGVLGPNGAGKTTLMRAVLGLVPARSGVVRVLDRPARRGSRAIGYMPQSRTPPGAARLTGRDYVACAVQGHRWGLPWTGRAVGREVSRVLELVEAEALAARPLAELSGGERQRLMLAQALLGEPRLLLLDEPLISLDLHRQRAVVALVRRLQRHLGLAVLFSAHELNPLLGAMDRVLYLGGGHAALGTVDEVITAPVLSRLYGSPIDVVRLDGRIFVLSGEADIQRSEHGRHAHEDHASDHGHDHHHAPHDADRHAPV